MHVVTCTGTHPLPGGIQYSNNLEVVAKEAGVTCSHVRMRNELGRHGWLLAGTCHFQIEWLFPCMEISDVGAKMLRMLRWGGKGARGCLCTERGERLLPETAFRLVPRKVAVRHLSRGASAFSLLLLTPVNWIPTSFLCLVFYFLDFASSYLLE